MQPPAIGGECAVRLWLVDIGCGHDLASRSDVQGLRQLIRRSSNPITFKTANGLTKAEHEVDIKIDELGEVATPYVLPSTPNVLTVGRRVRKQGYSYI